MPMQALDRTFSVAPMMDWTTHDYRAFARTLTRRALLYTEMVTTGAILHGSPRERFLGYDEVEHPLALQLGGSDARELAECAAIAEEWGYDEVNLNVGCPSDRVQNNLIGACLMGHPERVAAAVRAMQDAVSIPVTVKCRIGIDDQDEDADLSRFIATVADGGCDTFIVHARKAWLEGLSPRRTATCRRSTTRGCTASRRVARSFTSASTAASRPWTSAARSSTTSTA